MLTPVATSVALWPVQTAGELTTIAGAAFTVTLTFWMVPMQPAVLVPFIVNTVLEVGEVMMLLAFEPVLQV